jgi:hypothetical protein
MYKNCCVQYKDCTKTKVARTHAHTHTLSCTRLYVVDCVWNVIAHAPKPDFVFRRNGRVFLNGRGHQFSRLQAAELCASAVVVVVILDTPRSEVLWIVLATHSIRQFPLHIPSRASPCAITFQLGSTYRITVCNNGWRTLILSMHKIDCHT